MLYRCRQRLNAQEHVHVRRCQSSCNTALAQNKARHISTAAAHTASASREHTHATATCTPTRPPLGSITRSANTEPATHGLQHWPARCPCSLTFEGPATGTHKALVPPGDHAWRPRLATPPANGIMSRRHDEKLHPLFSSLRQQHATLSAYSVGLIGEHASRSLVHPTGHNHA